MQKQKHISWETFSIQDVKKALFADLKNGFSIQDVKRLQERYGKNIFGTEEKVTLLDKIFIEEEIKDYVRFYRLLRKIVKT